jgi:hypothetical protein
MADTELHLLLQYAKHINERLAIITHNKIQAELESLANEETNSD